MKAQIVSFNCVLKNRLGQVLSSSFNQDVINQLSEGDTKSCDRRLRGLVAGIQNVSPGERRCFTVPADEAYGPYDPDLVLNILRADLFMGEHLVLGSEVVVEPHAGDLKQVYRVAEIHGNTLMLDGNHPLAGHDLTFEIEVLSAREAGNDDCDEPCLVAPSRYVH